MKSWLSRARARVRVSLVVCSRVGIGRHVFAVASATTLHSFIIAPRYRRVCEYICFVKRRKDIPQTMRPILNSFLSRLQLSPHLIYYVHRNSFSFRFSLYELVYRNTFIVIIACFVLLVFLSCCKRKKITFAFR